jgi:hypothetical protein
MRLQDKIQNGLDDNRMLVLGCQVLLGLQFRAFFESGFEKLPRGEQYLELGASGAMVIAFGLLLTPSAYHRIVEEGNDSERFEQVLSRLMWPALLPLIGGLTAALFVAGERILGLGAGVAMAVAGGLCSLAFLYLLEYVQRIRRAGIIEKRADMSTKNENKPTELKDKIRHVLTEARLVLPGAQALLGFQFLTILSAPFEKLEFSSKVIHLISLSCVALAIVFLLTPAAYHRIVERGEDTQHMHEFASAMVLAATIPLGIGIAGDFLVVARKVLQDFTIAVVASAVLLLFIYGMWFGLTLYARARKRTRQLDNDRIVA